MDEDITSPLLPKSVDPENQSHLNTDPNIPPLSFNNSPNIKQETIKFSDNSLSTDENIKNIFFRPVQHGSLKSSIFCMICVTLGTGMLPIPGLFYSNGIILTFIIYLFCSLPTYYTLQLLITLSHENKIYDFLGLVIKYFGEKSFMTKLSIVVLFINSFGCIILWNFYISEFSLGLLSYFDSDYATTINENFICILILILVQIPLAIYNKGNEFDLMSTIGVIQIAYVVIVLIIEFPLYLKEFYNPMVLKDFETYFTTDINNIMEIPFVLFTAFGNHSTILSVVEQIKHKNTKRVLKIGDYTFYGEFFLYLFLVIICFFSTFAHTADNDIFLIRPKVTFWMSLGQFFMVILMVCNISLYYYTTLPTLSYIFNNGKEFNKKQNVYAAVLMLGSLTIISLFLTDLEDLLTFLGIFAQVSLVFVIPIALYLKSKENEISKNKRMFLIVAIGFYSILGIVGFFFMVVNKVENF